MRSTRILRQYIRELLTETTDKKFLAEFMPLYDEWEELQAQYGPVHSGPWTDPEGVTHFPEEVQSVPIEDQPRWVRDDPKFYSAHEDHPNPRRATFSQTHAEENIERALLTLYQKHAQQDFFRGITLYHDLNYRAAVQKPFSSAGLHFADFSREQYLSKDAGTCQSQSGHKDVMSCYGSLSGKIHASYGMILSGWVVFASTTDLSSQTLRTAHAGVREKHKSSGLPKRTSPGRVHSPKSGERARRFHPMKQKVSKMRGQELPDLTEEDIMKIVNSVILSAKDAPDDRIPEILVANWCIEGWFCRASSVDQLWPKPFWRRAKEIGITKPITLIDATGTPIKTVYIDDYNPTEWEAP